MLRSKILHFDYKQRLTESFMLTRLNRSTSPTSVSNFGCTYLELGGHSLGKSKPSVLGAPLATRRLVPKFFHREELGHILVEQVERLTYSPCWQIRRPRDKRKVVVQTPLSVKMCTICRIRW